MSYSDPKACSWQIVQKQIEMMEEVLTTLNELLPLMEGMVYSWQYHKLPKNYSDFSSGLQMEKF